MHTMTNTVIGGRSLLTLTDDSGQEIAGWPRVIADASQAMARITANGGTLPAPGVHEILADPQISVISAARPHTTSTLHEQQHNNSPTI